MEYEYVTTDTPENMRKVLEWTLADGCEVLGWNKETGYKFEIEGYTWKTTNTVYPDRTYRRKKSEFLTNVEEISRGIKERKVLFCPSGGDTSNPKHWSVAEVELTNVIKCSLACGAKYKYAEELFLTNAEVISKGIKAKKVLTTLETENGTLWTLANESNKYLIQQRLRQGSKYKLKPGETLPPKESEFLTDVEEISKGIKEGRVLFSTADIDNAKSHNWLMATNSDTRSIRTSLLYGVKYKYAEEMAELTDPIQIMHCILDGTAMLQCSKGWTKPMSADINDVIRNMHDGMKYWMKK